MTKKERLIFEYGKKQGREQMLAEILAALKIDDRIAEAIEIHEQANHN